MGLLTGITDGINEILDDALGGIPTFGAPGQQFNPLPPDTFEVKDLYPNWNQFPGGVGFEALPGTSTIGAQGNRSSAGIGKTINAGGLDEVGLYRDEKGNPAAQLEWGGIIKENTARINTVLEERSYLDFYFPNSNIGRRRVVFFENPKITEQRQPKYAVKNIVGRNEPVRLFVGADARKVKLTFTYTLPHVEQFFKMMGNLPRGFSTDAITPGSQEEYEASIRLRGTDNTPKDSNQISWRNFTAEKIDKFFGTSFKASTAGATVSILNDSKKGPRFYEQNRNGVRDVPGMEVVKQGEDTFIQRLVRAWSTEYEALNNSDMIATYYTQFVIDTLRASVVGDTLNNGNMPVGPPIVRFRHGTVFNEAPFVVKSMNVDYTANSGYEVRTLLPRQVKFSLDLEEFRQTHGSHHGDSKEVVQNAANIIELQFSDGSINPDRSNFPKHTY